MDPTRVRDRNVPISTEETENVVTELPHKRYQTQMSFLGILRNFTEDQTVRLCYEVFQNAEKEGRLLRPFCKAGKH